MSQFTTFSLFLLVIVMSWRDITRPTYAQNPTKDIPKPKFAAFAGPTMKFLYWNAFEQYARAIQQKYPDLRVEGDNFPPPTVNQYMAQILSFVKLAVLLCIISGQNPFTYLNMETPGLYEWAMQNKIYACLMIFFLSNAIEGQLISTGAFEVSFNDVPVWSKLETGRIPSAQEMFQIIDNHMKLSAPSV